MRYYYKGSFTIESSIIVPILLMMFASVIFLVFYEHDKNILNGAAYETAVVGSERMGYEEEELERFLRSRVKGKLLLFAKVYEDVEIGEDSVKVKANAKRGYMKVHAEICMGRIHPETFIRNRRKLLQANEKLGGM